MCDDDMKRLIKLMTSCTRKMRKTAAVMRTYAECHAGANADTLICIYQSANELKNAVIVMRGRIRSISKTMGDND